MWQSHGPFSFSERKSSGSLFNDERAYAFRTLTFFGDRHNDVQIRFAAVGNPNLLTTNDVFIAAKLGSSVDICCIGAGVWFSKWGGSKEFGRSDCGELFVVLCISSEFVDKK